jgi:D-glucosaminate-6-phosphate ammonia-lyase
VSQHDISSGLGLRRIINVAGTMTSIGSSIMVREAVDAAAAIAPRFVDMEDLHRRAGAAIAAMTGAEAGFVTASCSASITLAVAGSMTGSNLAAIERLPNTNGLKNEVVIQAGHLVNYGAPLDQAIRLAGAEVVPVGQATAAAAYQLRGAITERTTAGVFVVSHHVVHYGQIPLPTFAQICHDKGIPVIVDAASEYDLRSFLEEGADLVLYSGHKFLGGPTSGFGAGARQLVRAAHLQNRGIGRGMKVGKESIAGLMAALEAWGRRDHDGIRARELETIEIWAAALAGRPGVGAAVVPDPTGNPLSRLQVEIDPELARITAWDLAARLTEVEPAIYVRDEEIEHGRIELDPCNLHPGHARVVAARLVEELDRAQQGRNAMGSSIEQYRLSKEAAAEKWPD